MKERGSVLLHVMLTSLLVAIIAAAILRMTALRYQMGYRSAIILQEKRDDQALLAKIIGAWNSANGGSGQTCANVSIAGYAYSGTPGTCSCSYSPTAQTSPPTIPSVVTAGGGADSCTLQINSALRQ